MIVLMIGGVGLLTQLVVGLILALQGRRSSREADDGRV